jgi:hypothetical protein
MSFFLTEERGTPRVCSHPSLRTTTMSVGILITAKGSLKIPWGCPQRGEKTQAGQNQKRLEESPAKLRLA